MVIIPLNGDDLGPVNRRAQHLALFQTIGNEHIGLQAGGSGIGGDASREVAGRGAADGLEAELDCLAQRDGDDAILE